MYVDVDTIIKLVAFLTAIGALIGIAYRFFKWYETNQDQSAQIQEIKSEQSEICYVLLAALDGLKQLGANGEVTKAHEHLSKYINQKAHDQKQKER